MGPHKQVYALGRQILATLERGEADAARARVAELEAASQAVLRGLDELGVQYNGRLAA